MASTEADVNLTEGTHVILPPPVETVAEAGAVEPEEDLLRDVLNELDKERSKRAEVEADLRMMAEEKDAIQMRLEEVQKAAAVAKPKHEERALSRHAFRAMEAQVRGFQELVDALTLGKPAIAAAAKATTASNSRTTPRPSTLPLHVVRLLEVLPWDPRVHEHIFGCEVIYEWQVYDLREQKWHSNLRSFPARLKTLPISKPRADEEDEPERNSLLNFLAGEKTTLTPSKHGVLTDVKLSQILKIEAGYPLPQDGGRWEWVGGWRVDKRVKEVNHPAAAAAATKQTVDCDDDGWSFAKDVQDFELLPTELVWDNPGSANERHVRRRKWSRQRVLVHYPFASERTKQYLKLLAENARLTITTNKIQDQLVATKMKLTESEESMMHAVENATESTRFNDELKQQEELSKAAGGSSQSLPAKKIQEFLQKNDQVKEIGSKINEWVARKSSEDLTSNGSLEDLAARETAAVPGHGGSASIGSTGSLAREDSSFDWRKVGRGALIEKLAGKRIAHRSSSLGNEDEGKG